MIKLQVLIAGSLDNPADTEMDHINYENKKVKGEAQLVR